MVAKLGGSIQDYQGYFLKFIYDGDGARGGSMQNYQWKVFEEILSQLVAECMKTKMTGIGYRPWFCFFDLWCNA